MHHKGHCTLIGAAYGGLGLFADAEPQFCSTVQYLPDRHSSVCCLRPPRSEQISQETTHCRGFLRLPFCGCFVALGDLPLLVNFIQGGLGDGHGGVFVTGPTRTFVAPNQTGFDAFVRRFDMEGNLLWTRTLQTEFADSADGIALDGHGGIFISGDTQGSLSGSNPTPLTGDPFLARLDGEGDLLWVRQINSPGVDDGTQVTADGRGGVFITGSVIQSLPGHTQEGLGDAFIAHYSESGHLQSTVQLGSD